MTAAELTIHHVIGVTIKHYRSSNRNTEWIDITFKLSDDTSVDISLFPEMDNKQALEDLKTAFNIK